ncbi:MAG: M56 family metallopeptidase, partial [Rikenellaceae bacterium]
MGDVTVGVWCVVAAILFGLFLRGVNDILSLRRLATKEQGEEYSIYRLAVGSTPFSFWRGIYIGSNLEGDKLEFVLCHEAGHIRRHHYIDKLLCEIWVILLWFNPITQLIRRELSLIHEYEADNVVVGSGVDIRSYKPEFWISNHYFTKESDTPAGMQFPSWSYTTPT